ncbi:MAG: response regulator [Gammaproteobacteria bacterium]|nr:response regulator [Gammaproteobacteria bacterium]
MLRQRNGAARKVLLIDGDEYNIRVAGSFLYACGYPDVTVARSAKEAIDKFTDRFCLVLINVYLPDKSGLEVCKNLRQLSKSKGLPILALAPKGKGMRTKCFKVGMSNVMPSPTSFQGFKEAVQRVIN